MINSALMSMVHKSPLKFEDLESYNSVLQDIFANIEAVPAAIGTPHSKIEEIEFFRLPPKTDEDRLAVLAYRTGVSQLMERSGFRKDVKASIDLGAASRIRIHMGDAILQTGFELEGISYHLDLHLEENHRKGVYTAKTRVFVPVSYQVMRKFLGPKFQDY